MRNKRILFPNEDFKYRMWAEELTHLNFSAVANTKLYPHYLLLFMRLILRGKKVNAVVFRYLNDRNSYIKTLSNVIAELCIVVLCKVFRIPVFWIMHNVDKESIVHYPRLNRRRRNFIKRNANRVFVMDPLLIKDAIQQGVTENRLDWISFGLQPETHYQESNEEIMSAIRSFKERLSGSGQKKIHVGVCVSSAMSKFKHFLLANDFISEANKSVDFEIGLVLIGKFPKGDAFDKEEQKVRSNSNILHINKNEIINFDNFSIDIDFFYRSVDDLSISYSVFDAARCRKPVFTHNYGLLPRLVSHYNLGFVIPEESEGMADWINSCISDWNPAAADEFLSARTWKLGAQKLINSIKGEDEQ